MKNDALLQTPPSLPFFYPFFHAASGMVDGLGIQMKGGISSSFNVIHIRKKRQKKHVGNPLKSEF